MSIFPTGTVNLLAMESGYPRRADRFAQTVLASPAHRPHYPVLLGDDYFFACAGVGPDSFAVARVSERLKRRLGRLAYVVSAARLLLNWEQHDITLQTDAGAVTCQAFYVAKGRYYAGRWRLADEARVGARAMHVVALRTASRLDYLKFLWVLMRRKDPRRLAHVSAFECNRVEACAAGGLPIQADGDIVGKLPATMVLGDSPLTFC